MEKLRNFSKKFLESDDNEETPASQSDTNEETLTPIHKIMKDDLFMNKYDVNRVGNYVENYFFLKLKKFFAAKADFTGKYSIVDHIQKLKDCVHNYIKDQKSIGEEKRDQLKIKGFNIIEKAEKIFETKSTQIQVDSFFPNITGQAIKNFFKEVKEYSHCSKYFIDKIKETKNYNIVVESTHNILSTLGKKRKQLKNYFMVFSETKKLYIENKEILKNFYIDFLKHFKIISDGENISDDVLLEKSNFIYTICSNKHYCDAKLFQEAFYDKEQFQKLLVKLNDMKNNYEKNQEKKKGKNNSKDKKNKTKQQKIKGDEKHQKIKNENETQINTEETSKDIGKSQVKDNNSDYDPEKYLSEFQQILNVIEENNDFYLLVYLDSYDKLFIPYSELKESINHITRLYEKMDDIEKKNPEITLKLKTMEERYQKLENEYDETKQQNMLLKHELQELQDIKKKLEASNNEYLLLKMLFKKTNPEFFDPNGEIIKEKLINN